jgi:cytochrome P450
MSILDECAILRPGFFSKDRAVLSSVNPGRTNVAPPMPPMASNDIGGLGVLWAVRRNAFQAFPARCMEEPVVTLRLAGRPMVLVTGPEAIRHIMITHGEDYVRLPFGRRAMGALLGRGLVTSDGETWREQRRAVAPAFTPRNVPIMAQHIIRCSEASCARLQHSAGSKVDLLRELQMLSLEIATTSLFSLEAAAFGQQMCAMTAQYMATLGTLYPTDVLLPDGIPTPLRLRRAAFRKRWLALIHAIIAMRRKAGNTGGPRDLFDLLSAAHGAEREDLLVDEVSTMIFAGHETTALAMFWACTLLAQSSDWQEALAAEAAALDLSREGAAASLPKLELTRAVVQETLRLYPPAFVSGRQARQSHEICGTPVPANSMILLLYWILHRSPLWWSHPQTFDPARFLDGAEPDRLTYLPFGVGRHVCIGAQLAMSETILALARLLRQFKIEMASTRAVLPVGRLTTRPDYSPDFVLRSRGSLS